MKKILFYISMIFTLIFTLVSCSGIVGDDSLVITSIDYILLEDGRTQVTITYEDETIKPAVFYLPKGSDGNGIKEVFHSTADDGKNTVVEIYFTDEDMEKYTFSIPRGISVSGITTKKDSEGNTILTVNYDDGNSSEPITIPKGEKGDTGTTISDYSYVKNDDGSQDIKFIYSDGSSYPIHIPSPEKGDKGEDGVGVTAITGFENGDYYYVVFNLTKGDPQVLEFKKPEKPNQWLSGSGAPLVSLGNAGDYYFDLSYNTIYIKQVNELNDEYWTVVVDFDDNNQRYTVKFDLNDNEGTAYLSTSRVEYSISRGEYFTSSGYEMPYAIKPGYKFMGWCTKREQTATTGIFTDLTPVFADLTLYALWEQVS